MSHGSIYSDIRHVGDLGNIHSLTDETLYRVTNVFIVDSKISLQEGNIANILERSIVIHHGYDQGIGASGNAGPRVACGIIERGKCCSFRAKTSNQKSFKSWIVYESNNSF